MPNTLKIKRGLAASIPQGQLAEPLFTTDTYDLYIGKGSGGNQRFQKYIASGTSSQFLKGDGSLDSTTYQTALTFSSPLVNTSGTISIPVATGSVNGYLSSTDWTTFNSKEPAITAGTNLQYYRGDKTFQTLDTAAVPENGPVYFTEPRVRSTVLTGLNLTGGGTIAATDSVLQAFGKIQNQISAIGTGVAYQGTWNASTNTPTITSGTGTAGYYYVVNVAGSTNIDGITDWNVGDWIIFNGTTWDQVDNTDAVSSVNGFTGAVNLALDNISDVSAASPTNAQLLRFNGTSSLWENWTPTFEPALTKGNLTEATSSVLTITGGSNAVIGSGTTIEVKQASSTVNGYLSSTDWTTFNNKQSTITLTTTGTSGAATFSSNTLNIPQYQAALTNPVTGTGTSQYLAKFTSTGSAIGDSNIVLSTGANFVQTDIGSTSGAINNYNTLQINAVTEPRIYLKSSVNSAYIFNSAGNVAIQMLQTSPSVNNYILYYEGASTTNRSLSFQTEGQDRLIINQNGTSQFTGALSGTSATFSGNVGVGGSPSAWNLSGLNVLQVKNGFLYGYQNETSLGVNAYFDGTSWRYIASAEATRYGQNTGVHAWYTAPSGTAGNAITFTKVFELSSTGAATFSSSVTAANYVINEASANRGGLYPYNRVLGSGTDYSVGIFSEGEIFMVSGGTTTKRMVITSGGNVGIGTSSPDYLLTVRGRIASQSDNTFAPRIGIDFNSANTGGTRNRFTILADSNAVYFDGEDNYPLVFRNNGSTERMRINSSGDLLLKGRSTTANYEAVFYNDNSQLAINANNTNVGKAINFNHRNDVTAMKITSSGNIEATGSIKTGAPTGGTAKPWKFGSRVAAFGSNANTTQYIELEVDGTLYKLLTTT